MRLLEVEKFIAKCGVLGCPLDSIPKHLLDEISQSKIIEIVLHSDNLVIPDSIMHNIPVIPVFSIDEINEYKKYDARIKIEIWRRIVFKEAKLHSGRLAHFISILMNNPDGLPAREIREQVPDAGKSFSKWVKLLKNEGIIHTSIGEDEIQHITFNFDVINDIQLDTPSQSSRSSNSRKSSDSARTATPIKSPSTPIKSSIKPSNTPVKPQKLPKSTELTEEHIDKAISLLKQHKDGLKDTSIGKLLNIDMSLLPKIIEIFKRNSDFEVKVKNNVNPPLIKIKYIGTLETEIVGNEIVDFILDMCRAERIIILSDLPKEIKNMKTSAEINDEKFMEILEDNGFVIVEIRSKFISPEFVVFSDSVEEDDPMLLHMIEKGKNRIQKYFKTKVKYTFLKNMYFCSLDNNYSPYLKERLLYFYGFVCEQMKCNNNFFCFDAKSLLNMNFLSFVKCIPLRGDFQFIKTISEMLQMNKTIDGGILTNIVNLEDALETEYENINSECMEIAKGITLGDVLNSLRKNSEAFKNLESRLNIHEFDRVLQSLINCNIFEGFVDEDYLYFEKIDGIDSYIDKILSEITDETVDGASNFASYSERIKFYDMIRDIPQEQFLTKAYDLVNDNFDGNARDFFIKKLQAFK